MYYINYRRTWNITSLPKCWLLSWEIWCGFLPRNHFITRGFSPWNGERFLSLGQCVSPRERVAEGLCGWRHGNTFPMTQSAQSLRQMRSIPHCSKAVFYVFVFDFIHDSATMHNLSPQIFHWTHVSNATRNKIKGISVAKHRFNPFNLIGFIAVR